MHVVEQAGLSEQELKGTCLRGDSTGVGQGDRTHRDPDFYTMNRETQPRRDSGRGWHGFSF